MIHKTSARLVVMKKREVLAEIPCDKLETIFLYGSVQVSSQALAELLDHGIEFASTAAGWDSHPSWNFPDLYGGIATRSC